MLEGFTYRGGTLHAEGVPLPAIAAAVGTPVYVYSAEGMRTACRRLAAALAAVPAGRRATLCYAVKANSNLAVIRTLAREGCGGDVVSVGELRRCLLAGIPAGRIVYSGVGKTRAELAEAVEAGIKQFNVESRPELEILSQVAREQGRVAPVALRVNPDVDALTLKQITTGTRDAKFGIDIERAPDLYRHARALPNLDCSGIAVHIGSQVTDLKPFRDAYQRLADLARHLRAEGFPISRLDLGGGLAITYRDEVPADPDGFAGLIDDIVGPLDCELMLEPGRVLVGNAGLLLSSVIYPKTDLARPFLIVDAAMNDLIRPALYGAWHAIVPVREPRPDTPRAPVDVVGPVCESTDCFAQARELPPLGPGDLVAFLSAGAYGATMASDYNTRPLVPEVLVDGERFAVVRKRPTFAEMVAGESMPDWLDETPSADGAP